MPCKFGSTEAPCQFAVPEDHLVKMKDGTKICVFHLPGGNRFGQPLDRPPKDSWTQADTEQFNQDVFEIIQKHIIDDTEVDLTGITFPGHFPPDECASQRLAFRRASFAQCHFIGAATFDNLHLSSCRFDSAIFYVDASFCHCTFENGCEFGGTTFRGYVTFSDALFSGNAVFTDSVFLRGASWANATFLGPFLFEHPTKQRSTVADFAGCRFYRGVVFRNRLLSWGTSFCNTVFGGTPDFFDCEIHISVDFSTARFKYSGADARSAYGELRRKMEDRRDHVQQGVFHALEKRCERRTLSRFSFERIISWLYDVTSAYGISITRPLVWLMGLALFSAGIYAALFHIADPDHLSAFWCSEVPDIGGTIVSFSIQQMLQPFAIWSGRFEPIDPIIGVALSAYPLALRLTTAMQSVFAFGLIAVFLISVRWRYRRG